MRRATHGDARGVSGVGREMTRDDGSACGRVNKPRTALASHRDVNTAVLLAAASACCVPLTSSSASCSSLRGSSPLRPRPRPRPARPGAPHVASRSARRYLRLRDSAGTPPAERGGSGAGGRGASRCVAAPYQPRPALSGDARRARRPPQPAAVVRPAPPHPDVGAGISIGPNFPRSARRRQVSEPWLALAGWPWTRMGGVRAAPTLQ